MSWPWSQLGLPGPSDLSEVRHAYAEKLKTTHPEDDPEGFQRLHSAYQLASRMARQRQRGERACPAPQRQEPEAESAQGREDRLYDQLLQRDGERPQRPREEKGEERDFDFDQLLQGGERPQRPREEEEEERDFDFDQLLQGGEPPQRPQEKKEERDFDFDRLFAEGEAERAEARRRRGEERRRAQEQKRQERFRQEQERRTRFDQEQFLWQNTETVLHTIDMLYNAQADQAAWEKFFQSELFRQTKDSLDLIFGLEDFVSTKNLSQEVRLALFLAYGFDKGPSRPELRPLYQMLLGAWQAARTKKKKERFRNILAIPITLVLIYVATAILMSPLLIVFIALGLLTVHGLNKGWLKRKPKNLARGQRSSIYVLCVLAVCAVGAVFLLPGALKEIREQMPSCDPREQVCRYLKQDFGVEARSLYNPQNPDERFSNVFALEGRMFLAGPDGERDKKAGKRGYTTNFPDMMFLWALQDFAREQGISGIDIVNQNQGMASWETYGTYLYTLPFYGAGEKIDALGRFLEELAAEDWYRELPPSFEIVLCGDQMEEGRLILFRYKPEDGAFDAAEARRLYEESFAHAYCVQLLKEFDLDRDFVHNGTERYTLISDGMEELRGEDCLKLYGLREDGTAAMEYYVNTGLTDIYCVPASFWEEGGSQEQLDFYRVIHWEGTNGFLTLHYPWMRVN